MSQLTEQPSLHKYEIETSLKKIHEQDRIMRLKQAYPFSNKSYGGEHYYV